MGYQQALEAAGAKVLAFEQFGSYQGDWLAKVEYNGVSGWIRDYFGSCDYCDAYCGADIPWDEGAKRQAALKAFGLPYLDNILTFDQVLKIVSEHSEWDMSAQEMIDFVNEHK